MPKKEKLLISDVPRIKYTQFSRTYKRWMSLEGDHSWTTYFGATVHGKFKFREGWDEGYLLLTYPFKEKEIKLLIHTTSYVNNYNHKVWYFVCPFSICKRRVNRLFFRDGPYWGCMKCLKLTTFGQTWAHQQINKKGLTPKKVKKSLSAHSIDKKIQALKDYIYMRDKLRSRLRT